MDTLTTIIVYLIGYLITPVIMLFLDHYLLNLEGKRSLLEIAVLSILWPLSLIVFIFYLTSCVIPEKIYNYVEKTFFDKTSNSEN